MSRVFFEDCPVLGSFQLPINQLQYDVAITMFHSGDDVLSVFYMTVWCALLGVTFKFVALSGVECRSTVRELTIHQLHHSSPTQYLQYSGCSIIPITCEQIPDTSNSSKWDKNSLSILRDHSILLKQITIFSDSSSNCKWSQCTLVTEWWHRKRNTSFAQSGYTILVF